MNVQGFLNVIEVTRNRTAQTKRFNGLPARRKLDWRVNVNGRTLVKPLKRAEEIIAAIIQERGKIASTPCQHCDAGWGPFTACVVIREANGQPAYGGQCSNCHWGGRGNRCSFGKYMSLLLSCLAWINLSAVAHHNDNDVANPLPVNEQGPNHDSNGNQLSVQEDDAMSVDNEDVAPAHAQDDNASNSDGDAESVQIEHSLETEAATSSPSLSREVQHLILGMGVKIDANDVDQMSQAIRGLEYLQHRIQQRIIELHQAVRWRTRQPDWIAWRRQITAMSMSHEIQQPAGETEVEHHNELNELHEQHGQNNTHYYPHDPLDDFRESDYDPYNDLTEEEREQIANSSSGE